MANKISNVKKKEKKKKSAISKDELWLRSKVKKQAMKSVSFYSPLLKL